MSEGIPTREEVLKVFEGLKDNLFAEPLGDKTQGMVMGALQANFGNRGHLQVMPYAEKMLGFVNAETGKLNYSSGYMIVCVLGDYVITTDELFGFPKEGEMPEKVPENVTPMVGATEKTEPAEQLDEATEEPAAEEPAVEEEPAKKPNGAGKKKKKSGK